MVADFRKIAPWSYLTPFSRPHARRCRTVRAGTKGIASAHMEIVVHAYLGIFRADVAGLTRLGVFGSPAGLGGGAILVPLLTLAFNVDMRDAIGASLISVMATSSDAAAA